MHQSTHNQEVDGPVNPCCCDPMLTSFWLHAAARIPESVVVLRGSMPPDAALAERRHGWARPRAAVGFPMVKERNLLAAEQSETWSPSNVCAICSALDCIHHSPPGRKAQDPSLPSDLACSLSELNHQKLELCVSITTSTGTLVTSHPHPPLHPFSS